MIRTAVLAATLMLGGCVQQFHFWGNCRAETSQGLIGQPFTRKMRDRLRSRTRAFKVRAVHPGEMVTQEYDANRVTVTLDAHDHIAAIRCG